MLPLVLWACALLVLGTSAAPLSNFVELSDWDVFKVTFKKTYATTAEEEARLELFRKKVQEFEEHNKLYAAGKVTWKKGVNKFADWTKEELDDFVQAIAMDEDSRINKEIFKPNPNMNGKIPESFDWREKGAVTPVKDQGECGSCYAFGTLASVETEYYRKTGKLLSLSEQNIMDCDLMTHGCDGGSPEMVFEYLRDNGVMLEEEYPYTAQKEDCLFNSSMSVLKIQGYGLVVNESDIPEALVTRGSLVVSLVADMDVWFAYKEGVLPPANCNIDVNHGVAIVGYGTENGLAFYLIKNSWGEHWGEAGYVKVPRGENYCKVSQFVRYPIFS